MGRKTLFPIHMLSHPVLTCADGFEQGRETENERWERATLTPLHQLLLVPSQAPSEWDIKKLTKKLKGELAKEFAPATPPLHTHNSSVSSLSENEQNAIEKEEFMLKLCVLSEEVESSEGEEQPEVDVVGASRGRKFSLQTR